jgi:hypothetical protein
MKEKRKKEKVNFILKQVKKYGLSTQQYQWTLSAFVWCQCYTTFTSVNIIMEDSLISG